MVLSWYGSLNNHYRLQYRDDLATGRWLDLEHEARVGANMALSVTLNLKAANQRFFRIIKH